MDPSPRTLLLAPQLDSLAEAAERVETAEERLMALGKVSRRDLDAHLRMYYRAERLWRAARSALEERARELALDAKEGLRVDPAASCDAEDDDAGVDPATLRDRQRARANRFAKANSGNPGHINRSTEGKQRWAAKKVAEFEMRLGQRLA